MVFVVRCADLLSRENPLEPQEAIGWILEIRRRIDARVHQVGELGGIDLRAWNMNS